MSKKSLFVVSALALSLLTGPALAGHYRIPHPPHPPEAPEPPEPPDFPMAFDFDFDFGRTYLGVRLLDLTPELREHFGVSRDAGVLVSKVEPGSPAEKAGLKVGDIVTAAGDDKVTSSRDLRRAVRGRDAGEKVDLAVTRGRNSMKVTAEVAEPEHSRSRSWVFRDSDRRDFEKRLREKMEKLEKRLHDMEERLRK